MQMIQSFITKSMQENQIPEKKPRESNLRWLALFFGCFLLTGSYLCYDYPAFLYDYLISDGLIDGENASFRFNLLYSAYSFPNIVLPFLSGIFIDKMGVHKGIILFSCLVCLGQGLGVVSALAGSYGLMVAGRFVYGFGGDSLNVTQSSVVSKWFRGQELFLAMGFNMSMAIFGQILGALLDVPLYHINNELYVPLLFTFMVCVLAFGCGLCLIRLDKKADREDRMQNDSTPSFLKKEQEEFKLKDLKKFNLLFWNVCCSCFACYGCYFTYLSNLQAFLIDQYGFAVSGTNKMYIIPQLISCVLCPVFGQIVDKIGKRPKIAIFASCLQLLSFAIHFVEPSCLDDNCSKFSVVVPSLILQGIFYSIHSSVIWPCVSFLSDPKVVGSAFGIAFCIQNIGTFLNNIPGLTTAPIFVGLILSGSGNVYQNMIIFFIGLSLLGLICNVIICVKDLKSQRILDLPSIEAQKILDENLQKQKYFIQSEDTFENKNT